MSNQLAFTLLEAKLTLYLANADGTIGDTVWSGAAAENFRQEERWLNVETKPSGRRYPREHPLVAQYQLTIDRVWALPLDNLIGFLATEQGYVLEVVWLDEDLLRWHRRIYYGVNISERSLASRDIESGHTDNQQFRAEYFMPDSGDNATVPPPVVATPAFVLYRAATGLTTVVYTYAAGMFTNVSDASLATILADGSSIRFGVAAPVIVTTATGLSLTALIDQFPTTTPRLEFYAGSLLLAMMTPDGGLWARSYADDYAGGNGLFNFAYSGTTVAVLMPGVMIALGFDTSE